MPKQQHKALTLIVRSALFVYASTKEPLFMLLHVYSRSQEFNSLFVIGILEQKDTQGDFTLVGTQ